jgi:hypothetical protein
MDTPFVNALHSTTAELMRLVCQVKDNLLRRIVETNGWTLEEAVSRLEIHECTVATPPWFQVFDRRLGHYVSPRMTWGIGEDMVFRVGEAPVGSG